ncbi:hypothetical protein M406DRAFT_248524, partial [Cryphonectria parasitica EP155]
ERFRKQILLLLHFSESQLARITEILELRLENSAYRSLRNIFLYNKLICFVIFYYKNY